MVYNLKLFWLSGTENPV